MMHTLVDLLVESKNRFSRQPALVVQSGLRSIIWDYETLFKNAMAAAGFLRKELGLGAGDRIIILASNSPQLVACWFGAVLGKIIMVPIDTHSSTNFIRQVIKKTDAKAIIFSEEPLFETGIRSISVLSIDLEYPYSQVEEKPGPDSEVVIMFSSGPTNKPKGVVLTHENIISNVISTSQIVPQDRNWRLLSILPMSHMFELTAGLLLPLYRGLSVCYLSNNKSPQIFKAMMRYEITTLVVVPKVLSLFMEAIEQQVKGHRRRFLWQAANKLAEYLPISFRRMLFFPVLRPLGGKLDFFICGGAPLEPRLQIAWERLGVKVIQGYGATECSPVIASNKYDERIPGSVGKAVAGVKIRLSQDGEVQVNGANVTHGFWQDESSTNAAFTADGWFKTGDLGQYNEQGYLFLVGDTGNKIVLPNGLNVYPDDIEFLLNDFPAVKQSVVLPLTATHGSMQLVAVVIPDKHPSFAEDLEDEYQIIASKVNKKLAPYQRVSSIHLWQQDQFPLQENGKIDHQTVLAALQSRIKRPSTDLRVVNKSEKTLQKVRQIVSQVADIEIESLRPEANLIEELCLTSLSQVELAMELEKEFSIMLDSEDIEKIQTLKDLVSLIEKGYSKPTEHRFAKWPLATFTVFIRKYLQQLLVFSAHRAVARPFKVSGLSNLQDLDVPALFIANHCSHIDTISIIRALPQPIRQKTAVAAAADYFFKNKLFGFAVSMLLNTFPFSREKQIRASLEYCGELADKDWSILIYPEGTRSTTGKLQPFKSGIGVLAAELRVPVVPIAVHGGYAILPKGRKLPASAAVKVAFGKPMLVDKTLNIEEVVSMLQQKVASLLSETSEIEP